MPQQLLWPRVSPAPRPPSRQRPPNPKLTSRLWTRSRPIFPDTLESITARTLPSESAHGTIWTRCSRHRFQRSRSPSLECPPTSSATSELRQNDSTPSSYDSDESIAFQLVAKVLLHMGASETRRSCSIGPPLGRDSPRLEPLICYAV